MYIIIYKSNTICIFLLFSLIDIIKYNSFKHNIICEKYVFLLLSLININISIFYKQILILSGDKEYWIYYCKLKWLLKCKCKN